MWIRKMNDVSWYLWIQREKKKTFQLYFVIESFVSVSDRNPICIEFDVRVIIMCVRARARAFASTTRSMCALYISSFAIYLTIIRFSNKSGRQLCGDIFLYFFLIVYPTNGKISRLVIDFERGESIATMMISIVGTIHDGNRARVERDSRSRDRFVYIYIRKERILFHDRIPEFASNEIVHVTSDA